MSASTTPSDRFSQFSAQAEASSLATSYKLYRGAPALIPQLAAPHEEMHGIIRRSTPFGHLLARVTLEGAPSRRWHEWLGSCSRTSEEVGATFYCVNQAEWFDQGAFARDRMAACPEYDDYLKLGDLMAGDIELDFFKSHVVEAMIRFCWSTVAVAQFAESGQPWDRLIDLPGRSLPDAAFFRLVKLWPGQRARALNAVLGERFKPVVALLKSKPYRQIVDPKAAIMSQAPAGSVWLDAADSTRVLESERQKISQQMARISEELVWAVIDYLSETFRGTELAGLNRKETLQCLDVAKARPSVRPLPLDQVAIVEIVVNRERPLQVQRRPANELDDPAIVCVRGWRSFARNFDLGQETPPPPPGRCAVYAAPRDEVQADGDTCQLSVERTPPEGAEGRALTLGRPFTIVCLWASLLLQDQEHWTEWLKKMAAQKRLPWIVCDVQPEALFLPLRALLGEVNGFFTTPCNDQPEFGALIIRCLARDERPWSAVRGVICPASSHTARLTVQFLQRQLGDDFRGFGRGLEFTEQSTRRRQEGQFIALWLFRSEVEFNFNPIDL
ncbi:MAG: hypothetical protein U1G07_25550 [Verrucomicrobiota bacterium]